MTEVLPTDRSISVSRIHYLRENTVSAEGAVAESLQAFLVCEQNAARSTGVIPKKRKKSLTFSKPQPPAKKEARGFSEEHDQMLAALGCKPSARANSQANR
jgi:hypothetical protein